MYGCTLPQMLKMATQQKLTVVPNPLEAHKDTVQFDFSATLPVNMMKKGTIYTLNSFYKYGDKELALPGIVFKGDDYSVSQTPPQVTKTLSFPYQPEHKIGTLEIEGVAQKGTKTKTTPRLQVATGVITTSKLVQKSYYVAFAPHGYNNQEEIIPVVIPDFSFDQGSSVLKKAEVKSPKGEQLDAFIASKNITRSVTIVGTHSPEGRERINNKLSEERAQAIEKFYRSTMKKYDYAKVADSINFVLKPIVDDWSGFKVALGGYEGITAEQKSELLDVVNGEGTFVEQEKQLEKLPSYKKIYKEIYPGLRSAKTEILTIKKKKSDDEIFNLSKLISQGNASADTLSLEELLYGATLTPVLEEKIAIYQAATNKATNWEAHNNLGATYLQQAINNPSGSSDLIDKASAQFELAAKIRNTSEVNANLATIALMQGNPYKASSLASKALNGANNDVSRGVNGVKGSSEIYMAKYQEAVNSETSAKNTDLNLFNKGLAQILTKDYENASSSFNEAVSLNSNLAVAYYGLAIVAARTDKADEVVSNLTKAVSENPDLKQMALSDLEFSKYSATDAFKNALK